MVWSLGLHLLPANFPVGLCSVSVLPGCQSPKSPRCASKPKTKKIMYDTAENDDFDREEIATYEEVAKLYPRPGLHRPVVLIGPPGVGRNELKRRLIATDQEKYKTPIPCEYYSVFYFSFSEVFILESRLHRPEKLVKHKIELAKYLSSL